MKDVSRSNDESLCEKSMQVVINIIKLSPFPFTKMSPQTPATPLFSGENLRKTTSKRAAAAASTRSPSSPLPKSLKSQKVQKRVSYLLEPAEENDKSVYVIHNCEPEKNDDDIASDYIKKVLDFFK